MNLRNAWPLRFLMMNNGASTIPRRHMSYCIETFGCQMNKNDSELMDFSMREHGFEPADDFDRADIVIFNTCSVREHAENRALSRIRAARKKPDKAMRFIVVAGCMAQRIGNELIEKKIADLVIGPYQSPEIGRAMDALLREDGRSIFLSQSARDFSGRINPGLHALGKGPEWHRWVTITHGCENFCSYCIVPFVRGRLISFSSAQILSYIKGLAENGAREITLLGQNVNQYGADTDEMPFPQLLKKAASVEGIERINFLTSHPKDFSDEILAAMRDHPNISRSIHLPLQSAADRILGLMNRQYDYSRYLEIVEKIKRELPNHSLSTDLIVGFPGETKEEFEQTLKALENIRFDDAFTYAYSPRRGTPAFSLEETITREEKLDRLKQLIALQRGISRQRLAERIDGIEETIIERLSRRSNTEVVGRTFLNQMVVIPGSEHDFGKRIKIRILGVKGATLQGTRIA